MKKKTTIVSQPDKTDTNQADQLNHTAQNQKWYRDHRVWDHQVHGRANKFPFGSSHGPVCF